MTTWSIDLCDGFVKLAEVESLSRFNAVVHDNAIGLWRLESSIVGLAGADLSLVDSIVVRRDTDVVFAGLIRPAGTGSGGTTVTESDDGRQVVLEGVDLWGVLAARITFPDPLTIEPWAASHDVRTGVGSSVAAAFVTANVGSSALAARVWPGLTVVDSVVGVTGTWSTRLQRLDQLVARICTDAQVTCRPRLTAAGLVEIVFLSPTDRSASLIISDQGDLVDTQWLRRPASATWVLGAGQGELTLRTFQSSDGGQTGVDRIESLYDNTNITTAGELLLQTQTRQAESAASTTIATRLMVGASQRVEFLTDYNLGDLVAVEIDNVRYTVPVRSVSIEITSGVQVVSPVFGVATPDRLTGLLSDVDDLASRLDRQIA